VERSSKTKVLIDTMVTNSKNIIRVHPKFRKVLYGFNRSLELSLNEKIPITDTSKIIADYIEGEDLIKKYGKKKKR